MSREEAEIRKERSEKGQLLSEFEKHLTDDFVNWVGKKESI